MTIDDDAIEVRTIFISDVHLGTRGSQPEHLLEFLRVYDAPRIYLVGDIIDGWRLKSGWYWPQAHNDVMQKLLRKVRKGAHLVYVPGNHDDFLRSFMPSHFGGIEIVDNAIHETADGKRLLVIHGDMFDMIVCNAKWLALLGDWAYTVALTSNMWLNWTRRKLGLPYWSLSAWAKLKVKNAVNYIGEFETVLAAEARRHNADGVICGHIHHAAHRQIDGLTYINTGDWVESCTAAVEHLDGRIEIIRWLERDKVEELPAAAPEFALPAPREPALVRELAPANEPALASKPASAKPASAKPASAKPLEHAA